MNAPTAPDGAAPSEQAPLLNIANVLTVLRLLLVPVFIWLALLPGDRARLAAVVVFVVAAFTDRLDGQLARSWGLVTSFGKIADPIADKALTLSAFVLLSVNQRLWWWVTILIIVRELGITAMRAFFLRRGIVVAADSLGKVKTFLQIMALGTLLIPWSHFFAMNPSNEWWVVCLIRFGQALSGIALAITLFSGAHYVVAGVKLMREPAAQDGEGGEADDDSASGSALAGQHVQS